MVEILMHAYALRRRARAVAETGDFRGGNGSPSPE